MLSIRTARREDARAMILARRGAILAKAAGHYPPEVLDAWATSVTPERIERTQRQMNERESIILVAEAEGEVLGFGMAMPSLQELRALYVKPNPIGGVGRLLLRSVEDQAFQLCDALACDASLNAVAFYRVNGYAELGPVDHLLSSGVAVPCIRMRKLRPQG
jgi:hypothetical protein